VLLAGKTAEVLCVGRVGVDVYPTQIGVPLEDVETFGKFLGGSAANVAVAAARHGRRTALISKTGNDPFGRFVHSKLRQLGVDDCFVGLESGSPTPVTFCEIFPPDTFPLFFYRTHTSPDLRLRADAMPVEHIAQAGVFWATLTGCSAEPSREAHFAAWKVRGRSPNTVLDLDYRPKFWPRGGAREQARAALALCTVAVGNREECQVATGESDPVRAARALLDLGVELAVVKRGPAGALAMTAEQVVDVPGQRVEVVNGLGAGDAFGGALCHGLLAGWDLERCLRFANAAGGLVAGRLECSPAMPVTAEVEAALADAADA
jgi:5-dehydro-2-deoxygluconokinase